MYRLIELQTNPERGFDKLASIRAELFELDIQRNLARIDHLHQKLKTLIEEHIKASEEDKKWSILESVAEYFVAASSFVLGIGLAASGVGGAASGFLIAGGGLGLFGKIMDDTKGWESLIACFDENRTEQKRIASQINTGVLFFSPRPDPCRRSDGLSDRSSRRR